jgi:translation initiation factor eIF-2B subunit beta
LVLENAAYAIMQRANKVIIGAHAIMKNGGSLCLAGGLLLAIAAKSFSIPFIIISAMYKLTPKYPLNQNTFNELVLYKLLGKSW